MTYTYKAYVPKTVGEVRDLLYSLLSSPTMLDDEFPGRNIDTEFDALKKGLQNARKKLGEARYVTLCDMALRVRAFYEADPTDTNGQAASGQLLIGDMINLLSSRK